VPRKKKNENGFTLLPLPEKDSPDYFNTLVKNCIAAYEKLNNDSLALDYCKVVDRRLRTLVLNDEEYKRETKSIYARQRLEEVQEHDYLVSLATSEEAEDSGGDEEWTHPSERGKKKAKEHTAVDRDMLNLRFKALQAKREILRDMANIAGDMERDTVNHAYVGVTREEFEKLATVEINEERNEADFEELVGKKEAMPSGSSGKLPTGSTGKTKVEEDEDADFDILEDGTIVEK